MNRFFRATLFSVLMSAVVTACSSDIPDRLTSSAVDAQILNVETNEPIEGAVLLLTWSSMPRRSILAFDGSSQGHDICYHAETAVTDAQGHYHTEAWSQMPPFQNMPYEGFFAIAYKRGYVQTGLAGSVLIGRGDTSYHLSPTVLMKPFTGTLQERFEYLNRLQIRCWNVEPSKQRNLYPITKAIYDEMAQTAESKQQREIIVRNFKTRLDMLPSR